MARYAADTFLLGLHGEIHAGDEIPETFEDIAGEHDTDFDRLSELGLIADGKPKAKPKDEPSIDEVLAAEAAAAEAEAKAEADALEAEQQAKAEAEAKAAEEAAAAEKAEAERKAKAAAKLPDTSSLTKAQLVKLAAKHKIAIDPKAKVADLRAQVDAGLAK